MTAYPIETSSSIYTSCKTDIYNIQFGNALQLPLPSVNGEHWPIFDMLNNQPLTMTVDLINTGAYFVGGIRLCLRGPGLVQGVNTLHYLDTCQFYFTDNETIGHDVTVPIVLIKIINQTQPLQVDGDTLYDGRWTPTWNTANGLSDKLICEQNGEYLRYASYQNFLTITLTEQPFFVQNNQQPIIRKAELAFLLVKMIGIPLLLPILRFFHSRISAAPKENSIPSITTTSVSFGGSVTSTPKVKHKLSHIFKRSQDNDLVDKFKF